MGITTRSAAKACRRWLPVLAAWLLPSACGESSAIVPAVDAAPDVSVKVSLEDVEMVIVQGDQQEAEVGALLPTPLVVGLVDPDGDPVAGVPVTWVFGDGRGGQGARAEQSEVRSLTDGEGRSAVRWRLGVVAGRQEARALIDVPGPGSSGAEATDRASRRRRGFRAWGRAGPVRRIHLAPAETELTRADTLTLAAVGRDRWGNQVADGDFDWWSSDHEVASVDSSGMVRAVAPGEARIEARRGEVSAWSTVTVTERITPPAPDTLPPPPPDTLPPPTDTLPDPALATIGIVSGNAQTGIVDEPLPSQLVVRAVDGDGTPFGDLLIRWVFHEGTGAAGRNSGASFTVRTDEDGFARASWRLGTTAGTQRARAQIVVAADDAVDGPTRHVDVLGRALPGQPAKIILSRRSLELEVGQAARITAVVVDEFGNEIPDARISWSSADESVATVTEEVPSAAGPIG